MKDMKKRCWDPAKVFKVDLNEIAKEDKNSYHIENDTGLVGRIFKHRFDVVIDSIFKVGVGRVESHANHKLFEVDLITGYICLAQFEEIIKWGQKPKKTVLIKKDCVYISAMNIKNVTKHLNKNSNGSKFL